MSLQKLIRPRKNRNCDLFYFDMLLKDVLLYFCLELQLLNVTIFWHNSVSQSTILSNFENSYFFRPVVWGSAECGVPAWVPSGFSSFLPQFVYWCPLRNVMSALWGTGQLVQGGPRLLPEVNWDRLQPPTTLRRISGDRLKFKDKTTPD